MKKGDPLTVTQSIKGGSLLIELRWFEDDRAIYFEDHPRHASALYRV
jgi:hypothetical protein